MSSDPVRIVGYSFIADVGVPSQLCSTLFVEGCNFRCPYCINREVVVGPGKEMDVEKTVQYFQLRREKRLVISGGEPFLNENIYDLFELIKSKGMRVAVATNGAFPDRIRCAVSSGLVDHVIMDIKTSLNREKYSEVSGVRLSEDQFSKIAQSIDYLKDVPRQICFVEFRTTVCSKFVTKDDIFSIADLIGRDAVYFLQPFYSHQTLSDSMTSEYSVPYEILVEWAKELCGSKVLFCFVREV